MSFSIEEKVEYVLFQGDGFLSYFEVCKRFYEHYPN